MIATLLSPQCYVKATAPDWRQLAQSPVFFALVYPAVLRQVLANVLAGGHRDTDDDTDWRSRWLRFATLQPGMDPQPPEKQEGLEAALRWEEDAVAAFARKQALKEKFTAAWHSKEGA